MLKLDLPFWSNKGYSIPLIKAAQLFWEQIENGLRWPLTQFDTDTCTIGILNLLAWQRDITRFVGEPIWLYRLRVKYAYENSRDAGSVVGLKLIFNRLQIGTVDIQERVDGKDWDVIVLTLTDNQISSNSELLRVLVQQYGRTCRRYEFDVITHVDIDLATIDINNIWTLDSASF